MNRYEGIAIARRFRDVLLARGYPVHRVVVFGSVARGEATSDSDLDIAVVCDPFARTRQAENIVLRKLCWEVDVRIEPVCLHPADFGRPGFGLPAEVLRDGVAV